MSIINDIIRCILKFLYDLLLAVLMVTAMTVAVQFIIFTDDMVYLSKVLIQKYEKCK